MKLTNVKIKNFRSLDELDFEFNPNCRILVGINESGKSNILKALSMLDNDRTSTPSDMREVNETEDPIEESYVKFIFEFDNEESEIFYDNTKEKVYGLNTKEDIATNTAGKKISLKDLVNKYKQGVYYVDIKKVEKNGRYYPLDSFELLPNFKKITETCPADFILKNKKDEDVKIKDKKIINIDEFETIPENYIQDANFKDLQSLLGSEICDFVEENLPEILFWEYDEKNILPPKININEFKENPNICLPLKYMFCFD